MAQKMTMALFSGSVDKLTCAGVILSGAAADDMDVDIFVLEDEDGEKIVRTAAEREEAGLWPGSEKAGKG